MFSQRGVGVHDVAAKTLREGASKEQRVRLLQEATLMAQFKHKNIVNIHGVVSRGREVCGQHSRGGVTWTRGVCLLRCPLTIVSCQTLMLYSYQYWTFWQSFLLESSSITKSLIFQRVGLIEYECFDLKTRASRRYTRARVVTPYSLRKVHWKKMDSVLFITRCKFESAEFPDVEIGATQTHTHTHTVDFYHFSIFVHWCSELCGVCVYKKVSDGNTPLQDTSRLTASLWVCKHSLHL